MKRALYQINFIKILFLITILFFFAPITWAGQVYYDPITGELESLPSNAKFNSVVIGANSIGIAGTIGFGVGANTSLPAGFTALSGHDDPYSPNYGNYQYADGSIMVWIPKFYYKIHDGTTLSTNTVETRGANYFTNTTVANAAGYALHRAFIDGGAEKAGFLIDKYKASKSASGAGWIASSIKNGLPISTHADHNPIADLTACSSNSYYQVINAAHARDGVDGAVNASSIFHAASRFQYSALAMLSLAHGQASAAATPECAWYNSTYNYPKGCNNNALSDTNDSEILYATDGYSNSAKTGSGTPFAKTTHNGQTSGVADLNGLMYEISLGVTAITAGGGTIADISRADPASVQIAGHGLSTDDYIMLAGIAAGDWAALDNKLFTITVSDADNFTLTGVDSSGFTLAYVQGTNAGSITAGTFYVAAQDTAMKDFTSGNSTATDHWGPTGVAAMMEEFIPAFETGYPNNGFVQRYGSGTGLVLSGDNSGSNWLLTGLGFPADAAGIDTSGTNAFGKDYYYQYIRNELCLRSLAHWNSSSGAGVWAATWSHLRTYSDNRVGFRAACYPD